MPAISTFYGIIIRMLAENNTKHHTPHFHAIYQDKEASFDFDGNVLAGNIPYKQTQLVKAWALIHKDELISEWQVLDEGEECFKIAPLR